ncbi:hypothetical protein C2845_PM09G09960 [Panicum miliaceum]|uniref:Uncharacterized protein n=1 Tax=Panicum miliaceum TaxID=4540 RepID=A0A3L6S0D7_PANMI|nr:hypothetical protein C2845_PM09G09960 [Panicum miliaceum]
MTAEQREEKNRKRREDYKRKKCDPNNKENDPRGSDRVLCTSKGDDKTIAIKKLRREYYRMKKDEAQRKSVSADDQHGVPITGAATNTEHTLDEQHGVPLTTTPTITEHTMVVERNGSEYHHAPNIFPGTFIEHTADATPGRMVNLKSSESCTDFIPEADPQMTTSKNQGSKDSGARDFNSAGALYPEVPDTEPGSSGFGRKDERYRPNDESTSVSHSQSQDDHYQCFMAMSEDESNSDSDNASDDEDEEFMLELGKMSKRSRIMVTDMMKNLMKQDQVIEK